MIGGYFFDDDRNVFQTRHAGSVEAKPGCVYSVSECSITGCADGSCHAIVPARLSSCARDTRF